MLVSREMTNSVIVKDPICGMDIDTANSPLQTAYKGQTYHFCQAECKQKFLNNPKEFVTKPAAQAKSWPR
jgi:P-type Cu+ transporter